MKLWNKDCNDDINKPWNTWKNLDSLQDRNYLLFFGVVEKKNASTLLNSLLAVSNLVDQTSTFH
jgi:hypothetical protein